MASAWSLLNELFMIASATLAVIGWYFIRKGNIPVHRRIMLSSATLGAAFFVSYALSTLMIGDTMYGGPQKYSSAYQLFLQVHVVLATVAAVFGVVTIVLALRQMFNRHKKVAPWTVVMWLVSAVTGLVVYLLLFVIFPPGPQLGNLLHIITGHS